LVYYSNQTDRICINIDYPPIITNGLVFNVDAGFSPSYPTSGVTWSDISGGNNNGTLINGPTFNSANGGSIVFDGINDYVQTNFKASEIIGNENPFTISLFFNANNIAQQMLISCPDNPRFYVETFNRSGIFICHWGIGSNNNSNTSNAIINTNQIYNYVAAYDGNMVNGYLNGVIKDSTIIGVQNYNSNPLRIGKYSDGFPLQLNGNIYQTQIYNRALSAQEVLQNYNATKTRYGL
jgi:hypothetical protein